MTEIRKVQIVGDSFFIVLPVEMVRKLGISRGDHMRIDIEKNKLVMEKVF